MKARVDRFAGFFARFVALVVCMACGLLALFAAREMPGSVDLGTHRLRVKIRGEGGPVVVFESFGPAPLEIWDRVRALLSGPGATFAYDHAGYWGSSPGPRPRDARRVVAELRAALRAADLPPPYLLVGYSFGGPYTRVFADAYPDEVAGLILVDPTQERFMEWLRRVLPGVNVVASADRAREDEWGCQLESMQQAAEARVPEVPITLISASTRPGNPYRALVGRLQREHVRWLGDYPWARHVVAADSDHGLVVSKPEIVVEEIRRMQEDIEKRVGRRGTERDRMR